MLQPHESDYVIWQNRAFRFYEAARLLHQNEMYAPAAYSAVMSIELMLKATLKYWRPTDDPKEHGHGIQRLANTVRNKVKNGKTFPVPPRYFFEEKRYLEVSRYPTSEKGVNIPFTFIADLDDVFFAALKLTSFQHNTELAKTLSTPTTKRCRNISRNNEHVREIRRFLNIKSRPVRPVRADKAMTLEQLAEFLQEE